MTLPRYRGRFAPSPTGSLHMGSLVAALGSWLLARHHGGDWLLRIEDIDPPREIAGAARQQLATLAAFGMDSDEPVLWQSTRDDAYADALARLLRSGEAFACACSRSDLVATSGIHHACIAHDMAHDDAGRQPAIRLRVGEGRIGFDDAIQGRCEQDVRAVVGDFVLRRADGLWAYQLAVVVDDAAQGITHVVRGADLLDSTPRQIGLQRALGLPTPAYAHLPLVVDREGRKLSKSDAALPVDPADPLPALRCALTVLGQEPRCIEGAGHAATALRRALAAFDPNRIPRELQPAGLIAITPAASASG
ncbi:MAG: tRNA glutamyl-Q(34) synthetase GluQRS [Proteobacteria bacterium]|nr:tRNA glutamyl-Q(34) synthetase GluQRS [Pseudomonadota bacterium]